MGVFLASALAVGAAGCGSGEMPGVSGSGGGSSSSVSSSGSGKGGSASSSGTGDSSSSNSGSSSGMGGDASSSTASSGSSGGGSDGGVQCMTPEDCPATGNDCVIRTCMAGQCGTAFVPAGSPTATQTAGDCHQTQCDGNGNSNIAIDNSDIPVDANPCTDDICVAGTPSNPPLVAGTMCGMELICDGKGTCVGCVDAADCPGQDTDCKARSCTSGACGFTFKAAGTPTPAQATGDCKENQCDGAGGVISAADSSDLPVDNNTCTDDVCTAGVPSNPPLSSGTACNENGGTLCDGNGACVECVVAATCPGQDTDCQTRACTSGVCGFIFKAAGTPTSAQTTGDCKESQCDGAGGVTVANKDTDLPVDSNACTDDVCTAGTPSNPPLPSGTSCGGSQICNAVGVCVGCLSAATCPGQDTDCEKRTCIGGVCGLSFTPSGTPTSTQATGDCKEDQCNGAGGVMTVPKDLDVPVDGNACTDDVCSSGAPSNPPLASGAACSQNGGTVCDGSGACVECVVAATCPGQDTDCQIRACTNGVCGFTATPAGTPTSAQAAGDCKETQCDGQGGIMVAVNDADIPVDNNACTSDVCTNGAPSNPPVAAGSSCSQNGGVLCNGGGACVECLSAATCPGQDTDCSTRTCVSGACGVAFAAQGTPTSTQTAGDCKESQCNGAGGVVVANKDADVPVDNNLCTSDVCAGGVPSNPTVAAGTSCGANLLCNANGDCVGCLSSADCAGQDTDCQTRTCVSGTCGFAFAAAGTPTSTQTAGDCKENQCDGAGSVIVVNSAADKPVDSLECTDDVCKNGVPSNPPFASNTPCDQGGAVCNGNGTCVECITGPQCASQVCVNNACQSGTCSDMTKNGAETDVDCGGGTCSGCANGKKCAVGSECASGKCDVNGYCVAEFLLISEIQTRGSAQASDEFVEIYNSGSTPVTFDSTWKLSARSAAGSLMTCGQAATTVRYTGAGQVIPPHRHLLIAGTAYDGAVAKDATLTSGITDGSSLFLEHNGVVVDAVCFYFDAVSLSILQNCPTAYVCEGTPVTNAPHTNSGNGPSDVDVSLDRKPGSVPGNGQDTQNNATDFVNNTPANPQNLASAPTP